MMTSALPLIFQASYLPLWRPGLSVTVDRGRLCIQTDDFQTSNVTALVRETKGRGVGANGKPASMPYRGHVSASVREYMCVCVC